MGAAVWAMAAKARSAAATTAHDRIAQSGVCSTIPDNSLEGGYYRNDLAAEYLERRDLVHVRHVENGVLHAHCSERLAMRDQVGGGGFARAKLDGADGGLLDGIVVASDAFAVLAQD